MADEPLMPVTLKEARDWCGADIESTENTRLLTLLIKAADKYLAGSLGEGYPKDDGRVKTLALFVVDEWYNAGGKTQKVSAAIERMVNSFTLQIQLEMRSRDGIPETDPDPDGG